MGEIHLDLDRDRIKTVLFEAYRICEDALGTPFGISSDEFVSRIQPYMDSNRVSIPVAIDLPCKKYPGLKIEVDFRRQKVFARMPYRKKQAMLNHHLGVL